jgi:FG-GAP-like repeat
MPDLNADISLFNLNNRGANASLQTARNTYNQLLTDMNWGGVVASVSTFVIPQVTQLKTTNQNIDEAIAVRVPWNNSSREQLFYTTQEQNPLTANNAVRLWITDGSVGGTIELSAILTNNNPSQQRFDIINTAYDQNSGFSPVYFTRERSNGSSSGLAQPHTLELWRSNGTTTGTELVQTWTQISNTNNSRVTAIAAAQSIVGVTQGINPERLQTNHQLAQAYNSNQVTSFSNVYSRNTPYSISGGQFNVNPYRTVVDFGSDRLANLGDVGIPLYGLGESVAHVGRTEQFFVRNDHEIWLHYDPVAEKLLTVDGKIQAAYSIDNRVIVVTDQGLTAIELKIRIDPISSLLSSEYRALKELAREIGGETLAKEVVIPTFDTTGWRIDGIRDYDGDGDVDIFWRNNASGQGLFWQMNGLSFEKGVLAGPAGDYTDWQVRGFADFDRDGDQDMLWQNSAGLTVIWKMRGLSYESGSVIATAPASDWYFSGIGNFNGDRNLEILWRNRDGTLVTWEIQDFKLKSGTTLSINVGAIETTGWYVQAVTDFNKDGTSDILWNNSQGSMVLWEMQAGQFKTGTLLPPIQNIGFDKQRNILFNRDEYGGQLDIDGDGNLDIWWRSPDTNDRQAWTFKQASKGLQYAKTLSKNS